MNVYDFAPDLDLSKGVGFIFGVKGIEDGDGIVYAKVVSCVDGDWLCRYEQAAIEGGVGGALG